MIKRLKQGALAVGALAALAAGGSALAQAGTTTVKPAVEPASAPDRDHVQSGDQTTPDKPAAGAAKATKAQSTGTDTGSGSEAPGAETNPANEAAGSETSGSEAPSNDGPGGHADEPGNPNADNQFEGVQ